MSNSDAFNFLLDDLWISMQYINPSDRKDNKWIHLLNELLANYPDLFLGEKAIILNEDGNAYVNMILMEDIKNNKFIIPNELLAKLLLLDYNQGSSRGDSDDDDARRYMNNKLSEFNNSLRLIEYNKPGTNDPIIKVVAIYKEY